MGTADEHFATMLTHCQETFGETVTYTSRTVGAFNAATGVRAKTDATASVSAIRSRDTTSQGPGSALSQEVVYDITIATLTAAGITGAKPGDIITGADGIAREVASVDLTVSRLEYRLTTRREAR